MYMFAFLVADCTFLDPSNPSESLTSSLAILVLRTYAIWDNSKAIAYFSFTLLVCTLTASGYVLEIFLLSIGTFT